MKKMLEKLNISNINDAICIFIKILKIFYYLLIILSIYSIILIFKEWKIINFISLIFKLLSPLSLGIILSYLLNPLINKLEKNMKRSVAVTLVYLLMFLFLFLIWIYIYPKIKNQLNDLILYLPDIIKNANNFINNIFYKLHINNIVNKTFDVEVEEIVVNYLNDFTIEEMGRIVSSIKNIFSIISVILLGLIISFYLLLDFDKIIVNIKKFLIKIKKEKLIDLFYEIDTKTFSYIKGTMVIAIIVFLSSSILFSFVHLKSPIFFGLFNSITNIIPYIGPYIGAIPTILVAFTSSKKVGIGVLIIIIFIQTIESYILHPIIMSKSINLHPVTILISLLLFGYFFGIIGMVLAMPIVLIVKTIIIFLYKNKNK